MVNVDVMTNQAEQHQEQRQIQTQAEQHQGQRQIQT